MDFLYVLGFIVLVTGCLGDPAAPPATGKAMERQFGILDHFNSDLAEDWLDRQNRNLDWQLRAGKRSDDFGWQFRGGKRNDDLGWQFRGGKRNDDLGWQFRGGKRNGDLGWQFRGGKRNGDLGWQFRGGRK